MRTQTAVLATSFLCIAMVSATLRSQTTAQRPAFEVASIKPNASGDNRITLMNQAERLVATGVSLKMLMTYAYSVRDFQISGGPDWIATDRWDIQAKAEDGSIVPPTGPPDSNVPDAMSIRTQSLLEDRFQLRVHRQTKELPVYELVVANSGAKIQFSEDQTPPKPPEPGSPPTGPHGMGMRFANGLFTVQATSVPLSTIVAALATRLGRPILDKTGLKSGLYDAQLQWAPDSSLGVTPLSPPGVDGSSSSAGNTSGPSIFTALQEQLGLRLVSTKGPVEVLAIDSVQRPTVN